MTTIAIRDGIVAYDTRMTQGDIIFPSPFDKARASVKHQCVFVGCGSAAEMIAAMRSLEEAPAMPWTPEGEDIDWSGMQENATVCVITKDGRTFEFDSNGWLDLSGPFYAAGSGFIAALAAMHAGANAIQAVEIACKVDVNSGLPVRFFDVREIPPRPDFVMPQAQPPKQVSFTQPSARRKPKPSEPAPVKPARKPAEKKRA